MRNIIRLFLVLIFVQFLSAQQETENYKIEIEVLSLEDLMNLEVESASKQKETVSEAPGVLNVIPKEQIRAFNWNSFNKILYNQPGFFASQDYDRSTVGFRGLFEGWNNNHLLLLIDGIPFNDNQYGTAYTWEITPLFFANSVEILRGPGSALYGSNAVNGVVSINSLSAADLLTPKARLFYGDYGSKALDIITALANDNFSTIIGYQYSSTDGNEYDSYDDSWQQGRVTTPTLFKTNDSRSHNYLFAKIEGMNTLKGLSIQYHFQSWKYETGHGWYWMIPEIPENMVENRSILSLKYKSTDESNFQKEFVVRYQSHNNNWNMMWSPPDAWEKYYPQGMIEYLNTSTNDIFARAQFTYLLNDKGASVIGGLENTLFYYSADDEQHYSNINLAQYDYSPNPDNKMLKAGPWLEWVNKKPVNTFSAYLQYSSGKILNDFMKVVFGLRYDTQFFNFMAIDKPGNPEEDKSFSKISPRLAVLIFPQKDLTVKLLAGKAFRTPSPTEMFGANTWTLASAIRTIGAEDITTIEGMVDWKLSSNFNLKVNAFHTKFNNQTAYSIGEITQVANIYNTTNAGFELELIYAFDNFTGFANYSYVTRVDEEISASQLAFISKSDDLTWAPASLANIGIQYLFDKFSGTVQVRYQGEVKRRTTDNDIPEYAVLRKSTVESWLTVDLRLAYRLIANTELSLNVENIFDTERFIIKNLHYPFDYKMPGRRVTASLSFNL